MNCALSVLLYFVFPWAYAIRPYIFHNLVFVLLFGHDASCPNSKTVDRRDACPTLNGEFQLRFTLPS